MTFLNVDYRCLKLNLDSHAQIMYILDKILLQLGVLTL